VEDNGPEEEEIETERMTWEEWVVTVWAKDQPELDKDSISHTDQDKLSNLLIQQ